MTTLPQPDSAGSHALRVALYPRVSTPAQAKEGYGLAYQEHELRRVAEARGHEIVEVVVEPGLSRDEFNRPGLERLRELARAGKIDAVLAFKRDRYFAGVPLRAMFEGEMDVYGVRLMALDDSGGDRPEDQFSDGIKDLLSQLEIAKTRERTTHGSREKVRQGKVIIPRRVNYGFRANAARDQYEIDQEAAAVVRRIFREIGRDGRSLHSVTDALNREGIPSPQGKQWSRQQIAKMVKDDLYRPHSVDELRALGVSEAVVSRLDPGVSYGVWYYNRRTVKTWRDPATFQKRSKLIWRPKDEWIAVPVVDLGVEREWFDAAKEEVEDNVKQSRSHERVWELDSGTLACAAGGWWPAPRRARRARSDTTTCARATLTSPRCAQASATTGPNR